MSEEVGAVEKPAQLPFDLRTLVLGILRRSYLIVLFLVVAVPLAVLGALMMGTRVYQSETVLLYEPSAGTSETSSEGASLTTQMAMVKMQSNLEETRRRLHLSSTLEALGASLTVYVQRDTTLMGILARWNTPEGAAAVANTVREAFLDNQRRIRKQQFARDIQDLERRLEVVDRELKAADSVLQAFTGLHGVIDLDKEEQGYIDELTSIEMLQEQALMDKKSNELQRANIDRIIADLRNKVAEEQANSATAFEGLGELNIRVGRLRDAIRDDKELRSNVPLLTQKEIELESAKKLRDEGLISEEQYTKAVSEYEKQKALTVDTEQVKQWRAQIDELQDSIIPSGSGTTLSAPILRDMMLKAFEIQLQSVTAEERVVHLDEARTRVRERLSRLPKLQRDFITLSREVSARETERNSLESILAQARRDYDSNRLDFTTISEAKVPILPVQSNRRTIFLAILVAALFLGTLVTVALEFLDTTIKSGPELAAKFSLPLLATLPRRKQDVAFIPGFGADLGHATAIVERFRVLARRIRLVLPGRGHRILIVSAEEGEGRTWIASNLAARLGRQDERVLVVDAQVRKGRDRHGVKELIEETDEPFEERPSLLQTTYRFAVALGNRFAQWIRRVSPRFGGGLLSWLSRLFGPPASRISAILRAPFDAWVWGDGGARFGGTRDDIGERLEVRKQEALGLGDFLAGRTNSPREILRPTILSGVDCIPSSVDSISPDLLNSSRMGDLMEMVSSEYGLIILDGPPALAYVDAEVLAQWVDAVVFVVQSRRCRTGVLRKAIGKLQSTGKPVAGFVLNGVSRLYLRIE